MVGLIENGEAELRGWIEGGEAGTRIAPLGAEEVVGIAKQFQMDDGA